MKIKPLSPTKFQTIGPVGNVVLDFDPVIKGSGLSGDFVLGHWNKMLCLPGFYDSHTQSYHVAPEHQIQINASLEWVGIPKLENPGILPTSVNYHPNSRLTVKDGLLRIQENPPGEANGIASDF